MKEVLIICGPTASGKTYFAHQLAKKYGGEIIGADSRQIYRQLPVITASPPPILRQEIPYHLYNILDIREEYSCVSYVKHAVSKVEEISAKDKLPIIVGGSGMYVNALIYGFNDMPKISLTIREKIKRLQSKLGQVQFFHQLKNLDPLAADRLNIFDTQRTMRAYEIFLETGKSITSFHKELRILPLKNFSVKIILLLPTRSFLYRLCDARLIKMFAEGAIKEVQEMRTILSEKTISATKILGVQEIMAYLNKQITLDEALIKAQAKTRQYAKRQITWFRHQLKSKITIEYKTQEEFEKICNDYLQSDYSFFRN